MKKHYKLSFIFFLSPIFFNSCGCSGKIQADVMLISYDHQTVQYQLPQISDFNPDLLDIKSSDSSLFTITADKSNNLVNVESNFNDNAGKGELQFFYNGEKLNYTISVSVNHPTCMQEAMDSFTLAAMKNKSKAQFSVTFNFDNHANYSDFDESLEIYGRRGIVDYISYHTGRNKTNTFSVKTDEAIATKKSSMEEGDTNYYYNLKNINYEERKNSEAEDATLPIDSINRTLEVNDSDELFWSVEHNYRPIINSNNTNLNDIYNMARQICIDQVSPEEDNFYKFRQLYDYLNSTTYYDHHVVTLKDNWWTHMAYFLEGVFLDDGKAVCDGFSKAYALFCGIEGLPCFRSYGFYEDKEDGWQGHAWNYVQLDNRWYLVCPTWSKMDLNKNSTNEVIRYVTNEFYGHKNISIINYESFLTSKNYFTNQGSPFTDLAFSNIEKSSTPYTKYILSKDGPYHLDSDAKKEKIIDVLKKYDENATISLSIPASALSKAESWLNDIVESKRGNATELFLQDQTTYDVYAWILIRGN